MEFDYDKLIQPGYLINEVGKSDFTFEEFEEMFVQGGDTFSFPYDKITVIDQGQSPFCASASMAHAVDGFNLYERSKKGLIRENVNRELFHRKYCEPRNSCSMGRSLYSACSQARSEGFIGLYVSLRPNEPQQFIDTLRAGKLIHISVYGGLWVSAQYGDFLKVDPNDTTRGHALVAVDVVTHRGEQCLKIINSRGKDRGDEGYCYIRVVDIPSVITQGYAVVDINDAGNYENIRIRRKIQDGIIADSVLWKDVNDKQKLVLQACANLKRIGFNMDTDNPIALDKEALINLVRSL